MGSPDTPAALTESEPADRRPASAGRGLWFAMLLTAFEVGASIWVFGEAKDRGAGDVGAYLYACLVPVVGAAVYFVRSRDVSGASIAILSFNALSAVMALIGTNDAKVLLYKDCFATGIIGLIFAATLFVGRPLSYWFGQRFAGGGTKEGDAWWAAMWDAYPTFRRSQRQTTLVWAVVLIVEAGVKALAIRLTDYDTGYVYDQVLPLVAFALAITISIVIGMRAKAEGERRRAARLAGDPVPVTD